MSNSVLRSEYEEIKPINEKTLPEYFLAKAKYYAEQGRDFWSVDGLTDEKRYFNKFDEETRRVASALYKLGMRKGDVIIYMIKDLCKYHVLLAGVWRGNGIMRASYPDDDAATIVSRVNESKSKFIVCEEEALELCSNVAKSIQWDLKIITVNRTENPEVASVQQFLEEDDGSNCPELLVTEDDPAMILCTSGTTGLPKGAIHTHRSLLYMMRSLELGPFLRHKPNLIATKATHISGITPLIILACGKTAVVVSNLTKESIFEAAEKYKPGYVFAFPTFLVAMAEAQGQGKDFSSIEVIFTAGVALTPAIRQSLKKLPNLKDTVVAYGLTEGLLATTSAVLMEDDDKKETLGFRNLPDFSVGKVCPGTQLQLRNPDTLEILGPNEQGEVCLKSPGMFHSYLNNPEATKNAFVEGYFRTGDVGYFDENGFVYLKDRLKEIFKYYNNHISPTELENVISKHPYVIEACVVGVPDAGGHVPRAFVRLNVNSDDKKKIAGEIKEFADAQLALYKQLRGGIYIIDELPKGKTGKISRQILEKLDVSQM